MEVADIDESGESRIIAVVVGTAGCVCVRAFVWEVYESCIIFGERSRRRDAECEIQEEVVNGGDIQLG